MEEFFKDLNIWMLMAVPSSLLAIMLHEVCHGLAAYTLGDDTAKSRNRLSFNPLRHIDLVGLLMLIGLGFGWAKPVPVDPSNFKKPKRDMAIVALAGPVSNFVLSLVCVWGMRLSLLFTGTAAELFFAFFTFTAIRSAGLGVFNLIPIPPLDGSKVLATFLPDRAYLTLMRYERYGLFLLLGLSFLPRLAASAGIYIDSPLSQLVNGAAGLFFRAGGLYEALADLLAYVQSASKNAGLGILDVTLGFEPSVIFSYLRDALGTA